MIPEPLPDTAFSVAMAAKGPEAGTPPERAPSRAREAVPAAQRRGEYLWVPSCQPYTMLRRAASLPEMFSYPGSDAFPVAVMKASGLTVRVKMEPLKGLHDDEEMEPLRANLDGWTADALDAVSAKCLAAGRREGVEVSHADVLRARGLAEVKAGVAWGGRRGGWEREPVERARRALRQVAAFSIRTQGKDGRTGKEMPDGFARAFEFREIGDGRYHVKMGSPILHFLGGSAGSKQMEMLDRRVLALGPHKNALAKRLARHLADLWRIRADEAKNGSMSGPWKVETLLCAVGLGIGTHDPKRTLKSFRVALQTLGESGVVGEVDHEFTEPTKRKGWTEEWAHSNVTVAPPPEVAATYRRMFKTGEPPLAVVEGGSKEGSKAKLGEQVRERRETLGWRQRQLAELLGATQPKVARLEKGQRVRLSDEQRAKLKGWLGGEAS